MDSNTSEPREGQPRGDNSRRNNGGKGQNHKFHQRRRPNDGAQYEESSPNGSINVKPGRYDLPPSAEGDTGAIIKNSDGREQRRQDEHRPRQEKKRPEKRQPDERKNDQKPRQPEAQAQDQQRPEKQRPRPQNQERRNEQKKPEPQREPEQSGAGEPQNKPKRPRRRRPKNHNNGQRPENMNAEIQAQDEGISVPDTVDEVVSRNETYDPQEERQPRRPGQEQKKRPQKSRRGKNRLPGHREEQKNLSAAEINDISEEEAAISEYIAVAGATGTDEPSEAEIIEELNSVDAAGADTADAAQTEPEDETGDYVCGGIRPEPPVLLPTIEVIGVRFKSGGKIYYFDPEGMKFYRGDSVIVDTARGMEFGTIELQNRMVTEREVVLPLRKVVRRATADDIARADENRRRAEEALDVCAKKIAEHKLDMKLVDVEYAFDNSKLLFYFTADGRVDFRELVKDLASVFKTRIELRQIGIRDETKLLGGIGICGRPFCCKTFLSDFVQVSIKMAKEQNLSLNSVKISGACGRLMCCLRYEYDTYQEEIRRTPKVDQIVSTPDGDGVVTEVQPLAGLIRVRFTDKPDAAPKVFHRDDVTVIGQRSKGQRQSEKKEQQPKEQSQKPQKQRREDQRQTERKPREDAQVAPEETAQESAVIVEESITSVETVQSTSTEDTDA